MGHEFLQRVHYASISRLCFHYSFFLVCVQSLLIFFSLPAMDDNWPDVKLLPMEIYFSRLMVTEYKVFLNVATLLPKEG